MKLPETEPEITVTVGTKEYNIPLSAMVSQEEFDAAVLNAQIRHNLKTPSVSEDTILSLPGLEGMTFAS